MAFRLPTQAPPRRRTSYPHPQPSPTLDIPPASSQLPDDDESAQWVLFSPSLPSATARTHTNSTERTAGASRLSDFDSFDTQTRSVFDLGEDEDEDEDGEEEAGNNGGEQSENDTLDEEGTELDSLDDGLHAFRAPSLVDESSAQYDQGTPAVLPTHDGLGSFQASSQTVQDQLWQHEQYNPQRRPGLRLRRQSSVQRQLDTAAEQEQMTNVERERWQRIEKWRMEQSRALLQEVERETRRKRRRNSRASWTSDQTSSVRHQRAPSESLQSVPEARYERPASLSSTSSQSTESGTDEPFWRRITRKVIRDLIGIDDSVLSVIFGESLPEDAQNQEHHYSTDNDARAGKASTALDIDETIRRELGSSAFDDQSHWQTRLLQRIAHELGVLVHQLCEHPGAFTTYLNLSNDISNEYAGIPVGRQTKDDTQTRPARTVPLTSAGTTNNDDSILSPHFSPTLPEPSGREHAAQWGIEEDDHINDKPLSESMHLQREKEYWERELDIMMVFRYLRNRFGRGDNGTGNNNTTTTTSPSRRQSQDASRRAAIIRQHHPLVARAQSRSQAQQTRRQSQQSAVPSACPTGISSPLLRQHFRRPSSSCASHSAKLSAVSSRRTLTGSSRNYWDIGGSVESGSPIAPVGGSWGDV